MVYYNGHLDDNLPSLAILYVFKHPKLLRKVKSEFIVVNNIKKKLYFSKYLLFYCHVSIVLHELKRNSTKD